MPDANAKHADIENAITRQDFCKWAYPSRKSGDNDDVDEGDAEDDDDE